MSKGWIIGLVLLGTTALLGITLAAGLVGSYNGVVGQEEGIVAQWDQNRNNYDNMFKKFQEAAQVPSMYTEDMKKVYDSAIQSRYGKDGSKALFQFIKEQNPTMDSSLYKHLMAIIESGRNSFEADQKMLIDKRRVYTTYVRGFPGNIVIGIMHIFGMPKFDLSKYDIVTSGATEDAFKTKKADTIKLR